MLKYLIVYSVLAPGISGHLGSVLVPKDHLDFVSQLRPGMSIGLLEKNDKTSEVKATISSHSYH